MAHPGGSLVRAYRLLLHQFDSRKDLWNFDGPTGEVPRLLRQLERPFSAERAALLAAFGLWKWTEQFRWTEMVELEGERRAAVMSLLVAFSRSGPQRFDKE